MLVKIILVLMLLAIETSAVRYRRDSNQKCGTPTQSTSLVVGGSTFQRGTWPWMVALMQKATNPPKLFCGGVLVSYTKVLTGEIKKRIK
jgi:secreted trypsin-like serine protease